MALRPLLFTLLLVRRIDAFVLPFKSYQCASVASSSSTSLTMGLYDKPLPPRPAPRDDNNDDEPPADEFKDNEIDFIDTTQESPLLFNMLPSGKEANDLLPELDRYLTSGVGCYFEVTDRVVLSLAENANCHPQDAAWALEACRGDPTEAWTRIGVARRVGYMKLNQLPAVDDNVDWDAELFSLLNTDQSNVIRPLGKDGIQDRKDEIAKDNVKRATKDFFKPGNPDDSWMPGTKPGPVDDEPWFTG